MLDFSFAADHEIRAELGRRMRAQRLSLGLTQSELAERADISVNTLGALEKKGQCTLENLVRTAMGLGSVGELQALFVNEMKSIAQMERSERGNRIRAPRRSNRAKSTSSNSPPPLKPRT